MSRHENINEAFNSPPVTLNSFEDAELVATSTKLYLDGNVIGYGDLARLPYGAGAIVRINGEILHAEMDGRIESRKRFRYVKFPKTITNMV